MAIEIEERFSVPAPIDTVWQFLLDPEQVVSCMPGASLDEVVSDSEFLGSVQVRLGAVAAGLTSGGLDVPPFGCLLSQRLGLTTATGQVCLLCLSRNTVECRVP